MPRLIILLLTLASLTIVTVQNLGEDKAVRFVVLGTPLSAVPLGLLLLCSVAAGALVTLLLYGLVGLHRPASSTVKSKYQPMGSRVPYTDAASDSNAPRPDSSYSTATTGTAYGSSSTAFVTEPPADRSSADKAGASQTSSLDDVSSPQTDSQPGSPAASSNVYSPFSRDKDAAAKKKGPAAE